MYPGDLAEEVTVVSICSRFRGPPVGEGQAFSVSQRVTQLISAHEFLLKPIKHHMHASAPAATGMWRLLATVMIKLNVKISLWTLQDSMSHGGNSM